MLLQAQHSGPCPLLPANAGAQRPYPHVLKVNPVCTLDPHDASPTELWVLPSYLETPHFLCTPTLAQAPLIFTASPSSLQPARPGLLPQCSSCVQARNILLCSLPPQSASLHPPRLRGLAALHTLRAPHLPSGLWPCHDPGDRSHSSPSPSRPTSLRGHLQSCTAHLVSQDPARGLAQSGQTVTIELWGLAERQWGGIRRMCLGNLCSD